MSSSNRPKIDTQLASKISEDEERGINLAYKNISDEVKTLGRKFEPVEGVTYLWILAKANDSNAKEMITGIEKPWEYPQAFGFTPEPSSPVSVSSNDSSTSSTDSERESSNFHASVATTRNDSPSRSRSLSERSDGSDFSDYSEGGSSPVSKSTKVSSWGEISNQLLQAGKRGHASLATAFDEKGEADPYKGRAFIGGELKYQKQSKQWQLDNCSGRFGDLPGVKIKEIDGLMKEAVALFKEATGLEAQVFIRAPKTSAFKELKGLWVKTDDKGPVELALGLLTRSSQTEFKNAYLLNQSLAEFRAKKPGTVEELLSPFKKLLSESTDSENGLIKTLMFIARKAKVEIKLNPELESEVIAKKDKSTTKLKP